MSKLAAQDKFLDLSDYGRSFGRFFANQLKDSRFTPIHVTLLFGLSGLIAIFCILDHHYFLAGFFIILKSGIDAADGELARLKKTPSYSGRYLDSVFDIVLNFMFLMAICSVSETSIWFTLLETNRLAVIIQAKFLNTKHQKLYPEKPRNRLISCLGFTKSFMGRLTK